MTPATLFFFHKPFQTDKALWINALSVLILVGVFGVIGLLHPAATQAESSLHKSQDVPAILQIAKSTPVIAEPQLEALPRPAQPSAPTTSVKPAPKVSQKQSSAKKPIVLSGTVSLIQAIAEESETVDWYGWYMSAREYLVQTGGFSCPLGTRIVFYKSGQIRPISNQLQCVQSTWNKHFPLPAATHVDAITLDTRSPSAPPASKEELMRMLSRK